MAPLRIGIIGAGQISTLFVEAYKKLDDVEVYAVCDRREDVAIERGLEWNTRRCYTDYRALLADKAIDAVEILTPHHLHEEMAIAAAAAGKHIHMAKPISVSLRGAERVGAAVEKAGVVLQVCEPSVFYPPIMEARTFIDSGEIGPPLSIRMKAAIGSPDGGWAVQPESWLWRLDPARAGGGPLLFDLGYHKLATALYLLGPIEQVHGWGARTEIHPGFFLDSPTVISWKHVDQNRFGSLELTYMPDLYLRSETYPNIEMVEVTGSRGIIWLNRGPARVNDASALQLMRDGRVFSFNEIDDDWRSGFRGAVHHFVRCIREGAKPLLDVHSATRVLRVTSAAREATQHGGSVVVGQG